MCIVIDTNVLTPVFKKDSAEHARFAPVLQWIIAGRGKIVYGGSKYFEEISKYAKLFKLLRDVNKAVYISNDIVDQKTEQATNTIVHKNFDDQHLVGLLMASGCRLVCTDDDRAAPFLKNRLFFTRRQEPKIYHNPNHSHLLNPKFIGKCCGSCPPTPKKLKETLEAYIHNIK